MVVGVYVRNPHKTEVPKDRRKPITPKATGELPAGAFAAIQKRAPPIEHVKVDGAGKRERE